MTGMMKAVEKDGTGSQKGQKYDLKAEVEALMEKSREMARGKKGE